LPADDAHSIAEQFLGRSPVVAHPVEPLLSNALRIAVRLDHPVYDAVNFALALPEACQLVTADSRLIARTRGTEWQRCVRPLV
jgi:predicted nucleic acid-binding protein